MRTPALLAILDGIGIAQPCSTNAVSCANAPFLHELFSGATRPCRTLSASGRDVGLPDGQMGNSEVGHLNIGSGRIIEQELTRIDRAIEDGSLCVNEVLLAAFDAARDNARTLHFLGLLSDGGVHSMMSHLEALCAMAAVRGVKRIRIAVFLDGRDVAPTSGKGYVEHIRDFCRRLEAAHPDLDIRIGMISGRYFAMDRDNRWERVEKAWRALVVPFEPDVTRTFADTDPAEVVQDSYDRGVTDEFVVPVALGDDSIADGDSVVFFNFRPDRARELTRAFIDPGFGGFVRPIVPRLTFVCMTEYDATFERNFATQIAFPKSFPKNVLADYLAARGLRQLHIAETEKYAHVTFFLNGGVEEPKAGEQRILIPSPKVATYDLQPQMSAPEVTEALVDAIEKDAADVYLVNYANGDMVGHTGVLSAAIAAVEAVDAGLKRVVDAIIAKDGVALVTADHGNSEQMVDDTEAPWTAHTLAPVPLVVIAAGECGVALDGESPARLADIAPTLLDLMDLPIPSEWTGRSLLLH
ncbi:MAG: 2,3-bisphosphoglycerate-independent phosphoglycerate mutase [Coriobacteriales bacterium]|jgi:2,3-bisphosphoglycerate-independent phosphoglycerate mutase|nr:2,3-bisphosphoglycerate-independent phosphoglycerate mutase [Coriobacteriales bacterium]